MSARTRHSPASSPRRAIAALALAAIVTNAAPALAPAADVTERSLNPNVRSVALFKNGLGVVTREAVLGSAGGNARLSGLPVPVYGTFWAYVPGKPDRLRELIALDERLREPAAASSVAEILEANAGRRVELKLANGDVVKGRLAESVLETPAPTTPEAGRWIAPPALPSLVRIETDRGMLALERGNVASVLGVDVLRTEISRIRPGAVLRAGTTAGSASDRLQILYVARGIAWLPSYAVDLLGDDRARVTAKAEIVNDLENLDGVSVEFVTGFPNLRFAHAEDPIGMRGDLAALLGALQGRGGGAGWDNNASALTSQLAFRDERSAAAEGAPVYSTEPLEGQSVEGLFFYERKDVTLKRGERGYYPLFTLEVPAAHRYELRLPDALGPQDTWGQAPAREQAPDVWHSVQLTNSGKVPWTTAAAIAMRDGRIIAKDVLAYANPAGTSSLRITKAVDLKAEADEFEVERRPNAARFAGSTYDEIEVRGVVRIESFRTVDTPVTVIKELSGTVVSTTSAGKVSVLAKAIRAANQNSRIEWTLPLAPRKKLEVEYRYKVYVRS